MVLQSWFSIHIFLTVLLAVSSAEAKVYSNVPIKKYKSEASFDLRKHVGKTFLELMTSEIYPALEREAANRRNGNHINGVKNGEGVELRISDDVSTYHVKYKAAHEDQAERSGRSFSAVGRASRPAYVADASYKHYLTQLEKVAKGDSRELKDFYVAILKVIANCDSSGFEDLETETKRVAADFVAVYIAEQYRHLTSGQGKLGNRHNWDDALFQVTLLAAYHGGQSRGSEGMFYEGNFTRQVYDQFDCVYKRPKGNASTRLFKLVDYWQFGKNCSRSGVNVTRRDFQKMGDAVTEWIDDANEVLAKDLKEVLDSSSGNLIRGISLFFINNRAPRSLMTEADDITEAAVDFLMYAYENADEITASLKTYYRGRSGEIEYSAGEEDQYFDAEISEEELKANAEALKEEELEAEPTTEKR